MDTRETDMGFRLGWRHIRSQIVIAVALMALGIAYLVLVLLGHPLIVPSGGPLALRAVTAVSGLIIAVWLACIAVNYVVEIRFDDDRTIVIRKPFRSWRLKYDDLKEFVGVESKDQPVALLTGGEHPRVFFIEREMAGFRELPTALRRANPRIVIRDGG